MDDAVSKALRSHSGDNVEVRVAVDKQQVRRYVDALDRRFGVQAQDARLVGLNGITAHDQRRALGTDGAPRRHDRGDHARAPHPDPRADAGRAQGDPPLA